GDVGVNIGSGTFIPGFEDQLIGMSAGETRVVKITFPTNYMNTQLAGKPAEFDVTVKSLEAPGTVAVDDAFAKSLGLESLDKLTAAVKGRLQQEHAGLSRQRLKRQLLDKLDEMHKFALPPTLAEDEFKNVWNAVETDLKAQGRTFADEGTTEEKAREEYGGIAERRGGVGAALRGTGGGEKESPDPGGPRRPDRDGARQRAGSLGILPKESRCGRGRTGADLRREGSRFPHRARHRDRETRLARGTPQRRGGRKERASQS